MRFLHTADWHIGKAIRGRSRYEEYERALDQVVEVARAEAVDAVLVAGDLHDARAVTADADALIFDTLIRLHDHGIPVVAIPGNHDSAARLDAFAPLLARIDVRVVPKMLRPDAGGTVTISSRDGGEEAIVACIPFVSPARFSDAASLFIDPARLYVSYDENMGLLLDAFASTFKPTAVNVVM
ncbi:MAG: metallophosphoesterase family protein, partial [Actinomycetota bacterium]